jgi:hypothetical protein
MKAKFESKYEKNFELEKFESWSGFFRKFLAVSKNMDYFLFFFMKKPSM